MKKRSLILVLSGICLLGTHSLIAQTYTLDWLQQVGGSMTDWGQAIAMDTEGNVYSAGRFEGDMEVGNEEETSTFTSAGLSDIYIQRNDVNGGIEWVRHIGGPSMDNSVAIAVDDNQHVYIAGHFSETVDFDPGEGTAFRTSGDQTDAFILKLDEFGAFLWVKILTGQYGDFVHSLVVTPSGSIVVSGIFAGTLDVYPELVDHEITSAGSSDFFVLKLDDDGSFIWVKQIGAEAAQTSRAMAVDNNGNIYVTGSFRGVVDFDPGFGSTILELMGYGDIFILKLDPYGNFLWVKQIGGGGLTTSALAFGTSIAADNTGNVYVTGSFNGTADFDPGQDSLNLSSSGSGDVYYLKLNSNGELIWTTRLESMYGVNINSMVLDGAGRMISTGFFRETLDIDPGEAVSNLISEGLQDCFIQVMNTDGEFIWAQRMGGTEIDKGIAVAADDAGNICVTGNFDVVADFYPGPGTANLISAGSWDGFIHKLSFSDPTGLNEKELDIRLNVYPNPSSGVFNIEFDNVIDHAVLIITDLQGRLVSTMQIQNAIETSIEINEAPGIYLLTIRTYKGQKTIQLIKE